MRIIVFFIVTCSLFICMSCDLPEPIDGRGIVIINFGGGGGNGRAADDTELPKPTDLVPPSWGFNSNGGTHLTWGQVQFVITMSGGPGRQPEPQIVRYNTGSTKFVVEPGTWDIFIGVFYDDINVDRIHLFDGSILGCTITSGYNEINQKIDLELPQGALFVKIPVNNQMFSPFQDFDVAVQVKGFLNDEDARDFRLRMLGKQNLTEFYPDTGTGNIEHFIYIPENDGPADNGIKTFHIKGEWYRNNLNDTYKLFSSWYRIEFELVTLRDSEEYDFTEEGVYHLHESVHFNSLDFYISDGSASQYPIPVNQDNIDGFMGYVNTENEEILDGNYRLETDIDLTGKTWTPIGTSEHPFTGTFDGNGKKISNLTITGSSDDVGLFGFVRDNQGYEKGIVKNVWLDNCTITGTGNVGGIAGSIETGDGFYHATVENCFVSGTITGQGNVGGVVGHSSGGVIKNSHSNVTVTANPPAAAGNYGGILGKAESVTVDSTEVKSVVEYCYAKGSGVGNIVGDKDGTTTISSCVEVIPPPAEYDSQIFWEETFDFKFGTDEDNPWKWGSNLPILWFVQE